MILLAHHDRLKAALIDAITAAKYPPVQSLEAFYHYIDDLVQTAPEDCNKLIPYPLAVYYISAYSRVLNESELYQMWLVNMAQTWGRFLDTPVSTASFFKYCSEAAFRIEDYDPGPSGWMSFNQFFARSIRPGKRPICAADNPAVVVSPSDSEFMGACRVSANSTITSKGIELKLSELLKDSPYKDDFAGGWFSHSYLNFYDYHRYHTPVAGTVLEVRRIPGKVEIGFKCVDGRISIDPKPTAGYLFTQDRGLLVLDSPVGKVALLPIGMAQISSVTLTPELGAQLYKGQEFGYFQFGGSDVVVLYQEGRVEFTAVRGEKYRQGQQMALACRE